MQPEKSPRDTFDSYLKVQKKLTVATNKELNAAVRDTRARVTNTAKPQGEPLTELEMRAVQANVALGVRDMYRRQGKVIQAAKAEAAANAMDAFAENERELLQRVVPIADLDKYYARIALEAGNNIDDIMRRLLRGRYVSTREKMAYSEWRSLKMTDAYIIESFRRKTPWRLFIQGLLNLLRPTVPGGVSSNLLLASRVQANDAFHWASIWRFGRAKTVEAAIWHLSSLHPEGDECDDLARVGIFAKDDVPDKPHPNCFCYITAALMSKRDFDRAYSDGYFDSEDWMIAS